VKVVMLFDYLPLRYGGSPNYKIDETESIRGG